MSFDLFFNENESSALDTSPSSLDKYYTKEPIAIRCFTLLKEALLELGLRIDNILFIEPSAGNGIFLNVIKKNVIGFDISPDKNENFIIHQNDFLSGDISSFFSNDMIVVIIGNPPFGKKAKLAIDFLNKSFEYSDVVAFILPIQFRKWSVQSKIIHSACLIIDETLPESSFDYMGKDYSVRCCFQIWTNLSNEYTDLRIKRKPSVNHKDFVMYQFNRTKEAEKFFDYEWDFAIPRQGFNDYSFKAYRAEDCDRKKQWIFFKAGNSEALNNLLTLDYEKLSRKNSTTPGFGKADVIQEYNERFEKK